MLENPQIQVFFQLILSAVLGALLGMEREYRRKEAGLRTYCLVTLGSSLFTIIFFNLSDSFNLWNCNHHHRFFCPERIDKPHGS